ncbi:MULTISPECIES: hypothetical protein [Mycolicibacterium]|uniref:hypothetical protein n=1 Tax=Mycolicibacterium TaxID=1866885 RepID=UPI00261DBF29|nr:hypothetical protein [Mycolicibacterium fortuitum]
MKLVDKDGAHVATVHWSGVVEVFDADVYRSEYPGTIVTCGACGRSWDDTVPTASTPAPSGRCPFEYEHKSN